jgi:hypothetical protein
MGFEVCRVHGANRGTPGNTHAVKHGAYETLMRERLPEEERVAFDSVPTEINQLAELRILRYKALRLLGHVKQNVHGKANTWQVEADDFEKARVLALVMGEIRKLIKDMRDLGEADPLVEEVVRDWKEGMIADGTLDDAHYSGAEGLLD